jgi:ketosteroid isomerase-like protein
VASNLDVFHDVWLAFSEGRTDDVAGHMHPQVEWHSAMVDEVFRGPGAARCWIAALSREWKSLTVVLDDVHQLDDGSVVAIGTSTAFDYGGEQRFDRSFAWLTEFAGRRIVRSLIFAGADEAHAYVASHRAAA